MIDLIFSFDTTGSMYPAISEVRRKVASTVEQLFADIPALRVGIIAHGDYIDEHRSEYVTANIPLTDRAGLLVEFVKNVSRTDGGDGPECYERVLHEAIEQNWREGAQKILVMIGDAIPHVKGRRTSDGFIPEWDWQEEARKLAAAGVTIHAVQCLKRTSYRTWWNELAELGAGAYLTLSQFSHVNELIGAVAHHANNSLGKYEDELGELRFNRGIADLLAQLRGEVAGDVSHRSGLVPVPPSRFQILHVDKTMPIKEYVEATGAAFKAGRGFYEFVKPETVQERKEVILVDQKTGDMFSGAEARELLGLPYGQRDRIRPARSSADGYDVFIQSTSYNRKLMGGTRFLYEAERGLT